jgi:hypothetical protein
MSKIKKSLQVIQVQFIQPIVNKRHSKTENEKRLPLFETASFYFE